MSNSIKFPPLLISPRWANGCLGSLAAGYLSSPEQKSYVPGEMG